MGRRKEIEVSQTQVEIDPHKHARSGDPGTSHAAAKSIVTAAKGQCREILDVLMLGKPMTQDELAEVLGIDGHRISKRLPDLEHAGLAHTTGEERKGLSGRYQRVWRASDNAFTPAE
jgi:transcription initiation factor IIE alpha subunit